jgi:hypothetical protein
MTDDSAITSQKTISPAGQIKLIETAVKNLPHVENPLSWARKRGDFENEIRSSEITTGGVDHARKGSVALTRRSITRRSLGLNMIVGFGGLHGARGLADRLWTAPSLRKFATPVVLQQPLILPKEWWGLWRYQNQASAGEMIVEQLDVNITQDSTGYVAYARDTTEYQTRCETVELDKYTTLTWSTDGQRLIWTGSGTSQFENTCNPATNFNRNIGGTFYFSSFEVTGNVAMADTYPALPLTQIDSPTNPLAPLHNARFAKIASAPTASWGGWVKLDNGFATGGLAVASWAANRRDLFTISSDQALWHKWWDGGRWSGWERLGGGPFTGQPAAVSWGQNRLDIFAVGTDQKLWHLFFDNGNWGSWETFGGVLKLGVAAASWGPRQLTVYTIGINNSIYSLSFGSNGWSDFQQLNSLSTSPPAATAYAENELTLGCIGGGNNLYFDNYNSGYRGWINAGGIGLDVATASWGPYQFAFFVRGPDFKVYLKTYDNGSSNDWVDLDGVAIYPLAAIAPGPDWMEVYAIGPDHGVYQRVYS